ncbi:hypothetical protein [Psychrobacillus sp.]|uniref:hypothetical protein n=1 Tax=Psychrobacillus sp. TaxID=1871623 RepID=UPI0028BD42AA|nr:hypothetical protein [Psychrobacillus sp.]
MQMKWKKASAALLAATMTVTGASYAWANENLFDTVDLSKLNSKTTEVTSRDSVKAIVTNPETTPSVDKTESDFPKNPEGHTAGNLAGLAKAYENAGNETAKAEIKGNAERAIVKFEASQKERAEEPTTEESVVENPVQKQLKTEESITVSPVVEEPEKEKKSAEKEERKALQTEQKEERKALQVEQKEERKALQEEHKAEKQEKKK